MYKSKGFSLVELLVVLVILGLIMGLVVPNIMGRSEAAKERAAQAEVLLLEQQVNSFYLDTGRAPRELRELVDRPGNVSNWNGPYVNQGNLTDPWDQAYSYRYPGQCRDFDISTRSRAGDGKDITNCN